MINDTLNDVLKRFLQFLKFTVPVTYKITDYNGEEIQGSFYEQELQKTKQEIFRIEKIIRQQGNKSTGLHYLTLFELLHVLNSMPNLNLESLFNAVDEKLQRTRRASIEAVIRRIVICNYVQFSEKNEVSMSING